MPAKPPKPDDRPASPRTKKKTVSEAHKARWDIRSEFAHLTQPDTVWKFFDPSLSDTECAISAASTIDEYLKFLIVLKLTGQLTKPAADRLFHGGGGPLSSFDSRIRMAAAMGADSDVLRDLNIIREIRNEFAHAPVPRHFQDDAIRKLCASLLKGNGNTPFEPRARYIDACKTSVFRWHALASRQMEEILG